MSKKNTYKINTHNIIITIPTKTNDYSNKFILDNSFMYNTIRNDFAEEANKYKGPNNMYLDFDPRDFKTRYYNNIEKPLDRYSYYTIGLSEQIADNFRTSVQSIRTMNDKVNNNQSNAKLGEYHFKKFDYNRYSFRVKLKPSISKYTNKVTTRLKIHSKKKISFVVRANYAGRQSEEIEFTLKENLYDSVIKGDNPLFSRKYTSNGIINECMFYLSDIKDICFKYELGIYYIQLFIKATYLINDKSIPSKNKVCGIDTGIRHPITIYDGNNISYISMPDNVIHKIHNLENRIKRLERVLDDKNKLNTIYGNDIESNNVNKIIFKIRKIYKRITNIKRNWARNIAKYITTTYSTIVVDTFNTPDKRTITNSSEYVPHKIYYKNRFHIMSYTNLFIKHDAIKYGCKYIDSPENTTRTCSRCGYINDHLKLSDKFLNCVNCGSIIERDANAAINCYDFISS